MTDPIADLLTRIRNGYRASKAEVRMSHSNLKYAIAKVLEKNNFLASVNTVDEEGKKQLVLGLRSALNPTLRRISRPGQRIYVKSDEIKKVKNGLGIAILSTSKGVMTGYEAHHANLGGEYLCEVY